MSAAPVCAQEHTCSSFVFCAPSLRRIRSNYHYTLRCSTHDCQAHTACVYGPGCALFYFFKGRLKSHAEANNTRWCALGDSAHTIPLPLSHDDSHWPFVHTARHMYANLKLERLEILQILVGDCFKWQCPGKPDVWLSCNAVVPWPSNTVALRLGT